MLGLETCMGVSISPVLSQLPDYTGRRFNPVDALLVIQIKQFQQERGKKKKNCNEQKQDLKLLSFLH